MFTQTPKTTNNHHDISDKHDKTKQIKHNSTQSSLLPGFLHTKENILQLQKKIGNRAVIQLLKSHLQQQPVENNTGMPDELKAGLETVSGLDLSDVRVHHNSDKPLNVGALAYTQGTNIYIGPGQEHHLQHEGWHVVQQKQGRVQATTQVAGLPVNDENTHAPINRIPIQGMFTFQKKEYYNEEDIKKNPVLMKYLNNNNLYKAAVQLAIDDVETEFKTLPALKEYLEKNYSKFIKESKEKEEKKEESLKSMIDGISTEEVEEKEISYSKVQSWGHVFTDHGQHMAGKEAVKRAKKKGKEGACGVWIDNEKAAEFLTVLFKKYYAPGGMGLLELDVPGDIGLEYMSNSETRKCTRVFYKFSKMGGFITAFPTNMTEVHEDY